MSDNRLFMNKLYELRTKRSLTQAELAEACGLSIYKVGSIERGERIPLLMEAFILARFFDIAIENLFLLNNK